MTRHLKAKADLKEKKIHFEYSNMVECCCCFVVCLFFVWFLLLLLGFFVGYFLFFIFYFFIVCVCVCVSVFSPSLSGEGRKEGNVLFNDALYTFYLRLYGIRRMVKDHSDSEKGNPLPPTWATLSD